MSLSSSLSSFTIPQSVIYHYQSGNSRRYVLFSRDTNILRFCFRYSKRLVGRLHVMVRFSSYMYMYMQLQLHHSLWHTTIRLKIWKNIRRQNMKKITHIHISSSKLSPARVCYGLPVYPSGCISINKMHKHYTQYYDSQLTYFCSETVLLSHCPIRTASTRIGSSCACSSGQCFFFFFWVTWLSQLEAQQESPIPLFSAFVSVMGKWLYTQPMAIQ